MTVASLRTDLTHVGYRALEHLVFPVSHACECRADEHVRLQAHALELTTVGMPDIVTCEVDAMIAG